MIPVRVQKNHEGVTTLKRVFVFAAIGMGIAILSGCGGSVQPSTPDAKEEEVRIQKGRILAYAYMKDGTELLEISTKRRKPQEGVEIVLITSGGFSPDYTIPSDGDEACVYSALIDEKKKHTDLYKFCHSHYIESTVGGKALDLFGNALVTVGTAGLNAATGTVTRIMDFDREKFLEAVEENRLPEYRQKLLELDGVARMHSRDNEKIYRSLYDPYMSALEKVKVQIRTVDRSGLAPEGLAIEVPYRVVPHRPKRRRFEYPVDLSATPSDFDGKIAQIRDTIEKRAKKDAAEYRAALEKAFDSYDLKFDEEIVQKHNPFIAFHANLSGPKRVPYDPEGGPMGAKIVATVDYANLSYMLPVRKRLEDRNLVVDFYSTASSNVNAIAANKTKRFINIKSLTIYYRQKVNNRTGVNREIAPESVTLPENSSYRLLSNEIVSYASFEKMTLAKIKPVTLEYGYAIKYRIENTDLDRSIYETDRYRLYDIYKSRL